MGPLDFTPGTKEPRLTAGARQVKKPPSRRIEMREELLTHCPVLRNPFAGVEVTTAKPLSIAPDRDTSSDASCPPAGELKQSRRSAVSTDMASLTQGILVAKRVAKRVRAAKGFTESSLVMGDVNGNLSCLSVEEGAVWATLAKAHQSTIDQLECIPSPAGNGKFLASDFTGTVTLWQLKRSKNSEEAGTRMRFENLMQLDFSEKFDLSPLASSWTAQKGTSSSRSRDFQHDKIHPRRSASQRPQRRLTTIFAEEQPQSPTDVHKPPKSHVASFSACDEQASSRIDRAEHGHQAILQMIVGASGDTAAVLHAGPPAVVDIFNLGEPTGHGSPVHSFALEEEVVDMAFVLRRNSKQDFRDGTADTPTVSLGAKPPPEDLILLVRSWKLEAETSVKILCLASNSLLVRLHDSAQQPREPPSMPPPFMPSGSGLVIFKMHCDNNRDLFLVASARNELRARGGVRTRQNVLKDLADSEFTLGINHASATASGKTKQMKRDLPHHQQPTDHKSDAYTLHIDIGRVYHWLHNEWCVEDESQRDVQMGPATSTFTRVFPWHLDAALSLITVSNAQRTFLDEEPRVGESSSRDDILVVATDGTLHLITGIKPTVMAQLPSYSGSGMSQSSYPLLDAVERNGLRTTKALIELDTGAASCIDSLSIVPRTHWGDRTGGVLCCIIDPNIVDSVRVMSRFDSGFQPLKRVRTPRVFRYGDGPAQWTEEASVEWTELAVLDSTLDDLRAFGRENFHALHPTVRYACDCDGNTLLHRCMLRTREEDDERALLARADALQEILLPSSDDLVAPLWFPQNNRGEDVFVFLASLVSQENFSTRRPLVMTLFDGIRRAYRLGLLCTRPGEGCHQLDFNKGGVDGVDETKGFPFHSALQEYARRYPELLFPFLEEVYGLDSPSRYNPWFSLTGNETLLVETALRSRFLEAKGDWKTPNEDAVDLINDLKGWTPGCLPIEHIRPGHCLTAGSPERRAFPLWHRTQRPQSPSEAIPVQVQAWFLNLPFAGGFLGSQRRLKDTLLHR